MGVLDVPVDAGSWPIYPNLDFTVTCVDGATWTPPRGQPHSYTIDAGVLSIFAINEKGHRLPGTQHYSPNSWNEVTDRGTVPNPAEIEQLAQLSFEIDPT